jgi:hypothetical protein
MTYLLCEVRQVVHGAAKPINHAQSRKNGGHTDLNTIEHSECNDKGTHGAI